MVKRKKIIQILSFLTLLFSLGGVLSCFSPVKAQTVQDVDLSLSPASGSYTVGDQISVTTHVAGHSQEYGIATVGMELEFDKDRLRLLEVKTDQSPFEVKVVPESEDDYNQINENGTLTVGLGTLGDDVPSTPFDAFEMVFEAIEEGTATVNYTAPGDQEIVLNQMDDNLLDPASTGASYQIAAP